jgi:hypothetical protein
MMKQVMECCGDILEVTLNEAGEVVEMVVEGTPVAIDAVAKSGLLNKLFNKKVLIAAGTAAVVAGGIVLYKKHKEKKEARIQEEVEKRVQEILAQMNEENK